ncbi:MAG: transcription-repair coupling factor, partial [Bacteroidales bacterium]|nr:transcription-repair coupling factor [Bacteroidales bacterium]
RFRRTPSVEVDFSMQPQPVFNKKFDLLADCIRDGVDHGYKQFILSENPKQFQRLDRVFFELSQGEGARPVHYIPLPFSINEGFVDAALKIACFTDHQIFERYHRFVVQPRRQDSQALTLKELYSLKPGDYIMHIDHGIGRFAGLEKVTVNGREQEAICLVYKDNDVLRISIHSLHKMTRYTGKEGVAPVLDRIGSSAWTVQRNKAKQKVKDIARELIQLYAKRKAAKGYAFSADSYLQHELESSFFYEDTPDQLKASNDVKRDMESREPMDRLVCGDVGFGKTEVAVRAAFKAVCDGKQVAVLVPTTVLASQPYQPFADRLADFPCTVYYINRFRTCLLYPS